MVLAISSKSEFITKAPLLLALPPTPYLTDGSGGLITTKVNWKHGQWPR